MDHRYHSVYIRKGGIFKKKNVPTPPGNDRPWSGALAIAHVVLSDGFLRPHFHVSISVPGDIWIV
jgi:hypothetical protein